MKINKTITFLCFVFFLVALTGTLMIDSNRNEMLANICLSLFAGFIVSFVVSLIGYFNEKEKIVLDLRESLEASYINLLFLESVTKGELTKMTITDKFDYTQWNIESMCIVSQINSGVFENVNLNAYDPFIRLNQFRLIKQLKHYRRKMKNLNHSIAQLSVGAKSFEIHDRRIRISRANGCSINPQVLDEMQNKYNALIISISGLHEYETGLLNESEELFKNYLKCFKSKEKWDAEKERMDILVEQMFELYRNL